MDGLNTSNARELVAARTVLSDTEAKLTDAKAALDKMTGAYETQRELAESREKRNIELVQKTQDLALQAGAAPELLKVQEELQTKNQELSAKSADAARWQSESRSAIERFGEMQVFLARERETTRRQSETIERLNKQNGELADQIVSLSGKKR